MFKIEDCTLFTIKEHTSCISSRHGKSATLSKSLTLLIEVIGVIYRTLCFVMLCRVWPRSNIQVEILLLEQNQRKCSNTGIDYLHWLWHYRRYPRRTASPPCGQLHPRDPHPFLARQPLGRAWFLVPRLRQRPLLKDYFAALAGGLNSGLANRLLDQTREYGGQCSFQDFHNFVFH